MSSPEWNGNKLGQYDPKECCAFWRWIGYSCKIKWCIIQLMYYTRIGGMIVDSNELLELRNEVQKFFRLFGVLDQRVTPCGFHLSLSQVFALQELEKQTLTVIELSNRLLLERSTVSRLVDALVKAGFVKRAQNENNRREFLLSLTEKGQRTVEQVRNQSLQFYEKILSGITEEDQLIILRAFKTLTKSLENVKEIE
jgi:DNA-binding MarR family transcriptional regulator